MLQQSRARQCLRLASYQDALRKQRGQQPGPIPQMTAAYLDDQLRQSDRPSCIEELTANVLTDGSAVVAPGRVSGS